MQKKKVQTKGHIFILFLSLVFGAIAYAANDAEIARHLSEEARGKDWWKIVTEINPDLPSQLTERSLQAYVGAIANFVSVGTKNQFSWHVNSYDSWKHEQRVEAFKVLLKLGALPQEKLMDIVLGIPPADWQARDAFLRSLDEYRATLSDSDRLAFSKLWLERTNLATQALGNNQFCSQILGIIEKTLTKRRGGVAGGL